MTSGLPVTTLDEKFYKLTSQNFFSKMILTWKKYKCLNVYQIASAPPIDSFKLFNWDITLIYNFTLNYIHAYEIYNYN